ncbi:MAG: hypothetical protein HRU40_09255 [Saprospiraceae bacterium]|nr:hypothetical protein [Saprospiraceae bacterium]
MIKLLDYLRKKMKGSITYPTMIKAIRDTQEAVDDDLNDVSFDDIETFEEKSYSTPNEFNNEFIPEEIKILKCSKLSKESVKLLIHGARKTRKSIQTEMSIFEVASELKQAKVELETFQKELINAANSNNIELKKEAQRRWFNMSKIVGGYVIVTADLAAAIAKP